MELLLEIYLPVTYSFNTPLKGTHLRLPGDLWHLLSATAKVSVSILGWTQNQEAFVTQRGTDELWDMALASHVVPALSLIQKLSAPFPSQMIGNP